MINLRRKSLPSYVFKLNLALVCFFALWFTAVVAVMVAIGCVYGESVITYGVMGGGFAIFFIGLLVFYILDIKFYNCLIAEKTAEFENEYKLMPFDEAGRILHERGVVTGEGFVVSKDGVFGKEVVPFDRALLFLNVDVLNGDNFKVVLYAAGGNGPTAEYAFDGAMFNYLLVKDTNLKGNNILTLLKTDKCEFVKTFASSGRIFQRNYGGYGTGF